MRTLSTQVKLRRLIRSTSEAFSRLRWEPAERRIAGSIVDRLLALAAEVRESWAREAGRGRPDEPWSVCGAESRGSAERATAGTAREGWALELRRRAFERPGGPREVSLRGPAALSKPCRSSSRSEPS